MSQGDGTGGDGDAGGGVLVLSDDVVVHGRHDAEGNRLEPEEVVTERRLGVRMPMTAHDTGRPLGGMRAAISYEQPAVELADQLSSLCALCKHWDQRARAAYVSQCNRTKAGIQELNRIRITLFKAVDRIGDQHEGDDGEFDAEHALGALGVCHPLTDACNEIVLTHQGSGCPAFLDENNTQPFTYSYEARDKEADVLGSRTYDRIMRKAQGKE